MVQFWLPCIAVLVQPEGMLPDEKSSCKKMFAEMKRGKQTNKIMINTDLYFTILMSLGFVVNLR